MDRKFLKKQWNEAYGFASKEKRIKENQKWVSYWNYVASEDTEVTDSAVAEKVCELLVSEGVLTSESEILDVGSGNGKYALPLGKIAKRVTALDMSENMLKILETAAENEGIKNIKTCLEMWETFEPKESFDLVFASMCPGICDPEALDKMERLSKKQCVYITVAKNSRSQITSEILKRLTDEPLTGQTPEVIYPFNYLYSKGRQPQLKYFPMGTQPRITLEEGVKTLQVYFEIFGFKKEKTEKIIRNYLEEISVKGVFTNPVEINLAILYWEINSN